MQMRIWKTSYRSRSTYSIEDTDSNLGGKNDPEKEGILALSDHTINLKAILNDGDFYVRFEFKNYLNGIFCNTMFWGYFLTGSGHK